MSTTATTIAAMEIPIDRDRLNWVSTQLARYSYEHWSIELDTTTFAGPVVLISFKTEDNFNPGQPFVGESAYAVSDLPTDAEMFGFWVLAAIASATLHEVAEKVLVDGKLVANPHAPEFRIWSLGLYDAICTAARANQNAYLAIMHAAAAPAVKAGTVPPEVLAPTNCIDMLSRNVPRRLADAVTVA